MQNILVVTKQNSFLVRNMVEQLKELGYNTATVELDIKQIAMKKDSYEVILLCLDNDVDIKSQELVYVRDKEVEEGTVSVRLRGKGDIGTMPADEFVKKVVYEDAQKLNELE